MIQPDLIAIYLLLLLAANGAPVLAARVFGNRFARPLDGGLVLWDRRPLFGRSKTIRGLVAAIAATTVLGVMLELDWQLGFWIATASMTGDLLSSFAKRRLGLTPSSRATGLDQIPEALLPGIVGMRLSGLGAVDVALIVAIFFIGEILLSRLLYRLRIRRHPY